MNGTPILKFVFDRKKKATRVKEGVVELRIYYCSKHYYVSTGVRCLSKHWREPGLIVNRLDAFELQRTLDLLMTRARELMNKMICSGELDMKQLVTQLSGRLAKRSEENVIAQRSFMDFCKERAEVRQERGLVRKV